MNKNFATRGITLIELLIALAIIGLLLQLAMPAVQMAREAARKTQCSNNLRQIAFAFQQHHDTFRHLPTGGWGWRSTGHPDRGFDKDQPGGWCYNVLPFIDQQAIRNLGSKLPEDSDEKREAIYQANATPVALFYCPSRRLARSYPKLVLGFSYLLPERCREGFDCPLARNDYAANGGNLVALLGEEAVPGPPSLEAAVDWKWELKRQSGVVFQRSMITYAQITDGLSQTYCVGEKFVPPMHYKTGAWPGDDTSPYVGHDQDTIRHTGNKPWAKPPYYVPPKQDSDDFDYGSRAKFGSAHPEVFMMAFCDGSVKPIQYDIDPDVHRRNGGRDEAQWDEAKK